MQKNCIMTAIHKSQFDSLATAANNCAHPKEARRVAAERLRLVRDAGLPEKPIEHFHRPMERLFTAEERDRVTILFGGFTWKHERLIEAVFRGCGYRCQMLPNPDVAAFQTGKEFGNNGQCNPTYFTVGNLIEFLRSLEA